MKKYFTVIIGILIITLSFIFSGCESRFTPQVKNVTNSEITHLTPKEMKELMDEGQEYILIDVRSKDEYEEGHISGAMLIPVVELQDRLDELSKDKKIIVYCETGQRSKNAAEILIKNGFENVYDLGGIKAWIDSGYPVVMEKAESITNNKKDYEEISVDEAYQIFKSDKDYLFIDVRSIDEYKSGHIEGAINIPVGEIENRLDEIPPGKMIIVYCNGSDCNRSPAAANVLVNNGYTEIFNIVGQGIIEWIEKGYPTVYEK
jgi:rhodanese-related sulfurtransferase